MPRPLLPLALLCAVLTLTACQHIPTHPNDHTQASHSAHEGRPPQGQPPRTDPQMMAAVHQKACQQHQQGDRVNLDTPNGNLSGHCQLMFVPDQPPMPQRPPERP
jgi:hypothetical protein